MIFTGLAFLKWFATHFDEIKNGKGTHTIKGAYPNDFWKN